MVISFHKLKKLKNITRIGYIPLLFWKLSIRKLGIIDPYLTERVVEYPWVLAHLKLSNRIRILDLGCSGSFLSFQLASYGCEVYGIDLETKIIPGKLSHPNFSFLIADITKMPFRDGFFDSIIAVSTIEHVGLEDPEGDKKAMIEMKRLLKRGGQMLVTVPVGKSGKNEHRVYDWELIKKLFSKLKIKDVKFFIRKILFWHPSDSNETMNIQSYPIVNAIACIEALKR